MFGKKVLGWLLVVFLAFSAGCSKNASREKGTTSLPTLSVDEQALVDSYVNGLSTIAQRSTTADSLLAFYHQSSFLGRPVNDSEVQVVSVPRGEMSFVVVPFISKRTTLVEGQGVVAAAYSNQMMALYNNDFSNLVRGILLAHELVHAIDDVVHGENESVALSSEWLVGEGNALHVVYSILNEYTNGQWRAKALESAHERRKWATSNGHSEAAISFGVNSADSLRVTTMLGQLKNDDLNALLTQFMVDVNMLNFYEVSGNNMDEYQYLAGEFLHEFYSKNDPQ
ncbi:MAG: hypothetical protein WCT33_04270 [Patescibacteria group bacterium]